MNVTTENKALAELYTNGTTAERKYRCLPASTIKGYIKAVDIMKQAGRVEDLLRYNGLRYERLNGSSGTESVRCDKKYRLLFKSGSDGESVIITEVDLLDITNHYEHL